ncbi:hypothetical protein H6P81_007020 [Aristolochia fimbriata]|uniref:Uncharacterized protein n=1 Tax=Aristolochia fimbriata TaxID=158543 RepID=A0AAV7F063_ARIFI|nr:hypothetical protein H6P81_007020 [Aristolochia fimbriata]
MTIIALNVDGRCRWWLSCSGSGSESRIGPLQLWVRQRLNGGAWPSTVESTGGSPTRNSVNSRARGWKDDKPPDSGVMALNFDDGYGSTFRAPSRRRDPQSHSLRHRVCRLFTLCSLL